MKGIGLFCFVRAEITSEDQSLIQLFLYDYDTNKMAFPFLVKTKKTNNGVFFVQKIFYTKNDNCIDFLSIST